MLRCYSLFNQTNKRTNRQISKHRTKQIRLQKHTHTHTHTHFLCSNKAPLDHWQKRNTSDNAETKRDYRTKSHTLTHSHTHIKTIKEKKCDRLLSTRRGRLGRRRRAS